MKKQERKKKEKPEKETEKQRSREERETEERQKERVRQIMSVRRNQMTAIKAEPENNIMPLTQVSGTTFCGICCRNSKTSALF